MKASAFVDLYSDKALSIWEGAAVIAAPLDVGWTELLIASGNHALVILVANDYVRLGEGDDTMLMPLTPKSAQLVADKIDALLPTPKLVRAIQDAPGAIKTVPHPMVPNKGASLRQFAGHSAIVDSGFGGQKGLRTGHKKDVVVSNIFQPGKVLIYGWFEPNGTRIQPLSNVHGDFYVDYSHGIRLISRHAKLDGKDTDLLDVYTSPDLAVLVSDEGKVRVPRYPTGGPIPGIRKGHSTGYAELGTEIVKEQALAENER